MMKLAEFHANATAAKPPKRPSIKQRKQRLLSFLRGIKQFGSQNLSKTFCCVLRCLYWSVFFHYWQKSMSRSTWNGQPSDVQFADGWKIGTTTRSLSATGDVLNCVVSLKLFDKSKILIEKHYFVIE